MYGSDRSRRRRRSASKLSLSQRKKRQQQEDASMEAETNDDEATVGKCMNDAVISLLSDDDDDESEADVKKDASIQCKALPSCPIASPHIISLVDDDDNDKSDERDCISASCTHQNPSVALTDLEAVAVTPPPPPISTTAAAATTTAISVEAISCSKNIPQKKKYKDIDSAYLQHLSEMCFTILHDDRWNIQQPSDDDDDDEKKILFSRCHGDDLSVVIAFSKLYIFNNTTTNPAGKHDEIDLNNQNEALTSMNSNNSCPNAYDTQKLKEDDMIQDRTKHAKLCKNKINSDDDNLCMSNQAQGNKYDQRNEQDHDDDDADADAEARIMHLYARLYHRKGPWFTLDDLYTRYYAPDFHSSQSEEKEETKVVDKQEKYDNDLEVGDTNNGNNNDADECRDAANDLMAKKLNFFTPKKQQRRHNNIARKRDDTPTPTKYNTKTNHKISQRDHSHLLQQQHMQAITQFFQDITRLFSLGFIRTFTSEKECGLYAGQICTKTGNGVLLTAEERRLVLQKLGGGRKQRKDAGKKKNDLDVEGTGVFKKRKRKRGGAGVNYANEIWYQMCHQKPLFFSSATNKNKTSLSTTTTSNEILLPVRRHVNEILLKKLSSKIQPKITAEGGTMSITDITHQLKLAWKKCRHNNNNTSPIFSSTSFPVMCIRLHENPLLTLRRLSRLYLCASAGPGATRGSEDSSNGWRSVIDCPSLSCPPSDPSCSSSSSVLNQQSDCKNTIKQEIQNTGIVNIPSSPSSESWHRVVYPGLHFRLGLTDCNFFHSYEPLSTLIREKNKGVSSSTSSSSSAVKSCHANEQYNINTEQQHQKQPSIQIFSSRTNFHLWELSVELRCQIDYLVELNDAVHYFCRRIAREKKRKKQLQQSMLTTALEKEEDDENNMKDMEAIQDDDDSKEQTDQTIASKNTAADFTKQPPFSDTTLNQKNTTCIYDDPDTISNQLIEDKLHLLTVSGRRAIIKKMLIFSMSQENDVPIAGYDCLDGNNRESLESPECIVDIIHKKVEKAIKSLHKNENDDACETTIDENASGRKKTDSPSNRSKTDCNEEFTEDESIGSNDRFKNDIERMFFVFAVACYHVLQIRFKTIPACDIDSLSKRPWLRHLTFDAVLAYIIWDCVPILEKRGYYNFCVCLLELILLGTDGSEYGDVECALLNGGASDCDLDGQISKILRVQSTSCICSKAFVPLLLSRRTRGKAFERLVIDKSHLLRSSLSSSSCSKLSTPKKRSPKKKKSAAQSKNTKNVKQLNTSVTQLRIICKKALDTVGKDGSIPFSSIRSLARRLKVPLSMTMNEIINMEMLELGIRLENDVNDSPMIDPNRNRTSSINPSAYQDWKPKVDFSVANAITHGIDSGAGKRCSYVGWETESKKEMVLHRSLNVEELAMEEYASGRLPATDSDCTGNIHGGGWVGWHDEGGHIRALFRILCSKALLSDDFEYCQNYGEPPVEKREQRTIFLTPYQAAPHDLHVGQSLCSYITRDSPLRNGNQETISASVPSRSFFERRRVKIERFLRDIECMSQQQLCDLVHKSVTSHISSLDEDSIRMNDVFLSRDFKELRTLSMIAAGLGGHLLSAIFRCLCFDYRHYSGGMPDLLVARAIYKDITSSATVDEEKLVDLGEWVGEAFDSKELQRGKINELAKCLVDRDDEFLGCSKTSDSTTSSNGQWRRRGSRRKANHCEENENANEAIQNDPLPPKLSLDHNGRSIEVQCMFVEVKSANDKLDARQEDWLNVLDKYGNARVCKFGSSTHK